MTIFDTCVKITSSFEGTDWGTVSGNFDGQGISLGLLQWNLGTGSLQDNILLHINPMSYEFPVPITPLLRMTPKESLIWCKDNILDLNNKVKPEWREAFKAFLTNETIINIQKRAIDKYFHRAKELCGKMGFNQDNKRVMAWCFDLAVQSWSLQIEPPKPNKEQTESIITMYDQQNAVAWHGINFTNEQQILIIASHLRALKCKPEWRRDFFIRKSVIAVGRGTVHGKKYDFRQLYFMES